MTPTSRISIAAGSISGALVLSFILLFLLLLRWKKRATTRAIDVESPPPTPLPKNAHWTQKAPPVALRVSNSPRGAPSARQLQSMPLPPPPPPPLPAQPPLQRSPVFVVAPPSAFLQPSQAPHTMKLKRDTSLQRDRSLGVGFTPTKSRWSDYSALQ